MSAIDGMLVGGAVATALFVFLRSRGSLSGAEARKLVSEGAALVDVRSRAEFASGHLEGARNIPVDELPRRLSELGAKGKPVVLYCASGIRSASASRSLRNSGFSQVHNLGPLRRW